MIDPHLAAFAIAAGVLTITPGQDTMLVVRNVLRGGRGDGVVTTVGICTGLFMHATLSALGVSVLLTRSAAAFETVKIAGALYLGWLGLRSLWAAMRGREQADAPDVASVAGAVSRRRSFLEGLLSNLLNPKTALFYLAFLPQFIRPGDAVLGRSLLLASIHWAEGIVWLVLVAVAVDRTRQLFLTATVRRWLDGLCGLVFLGFGARLALQPR